MKGFFVLVITACAMGWIAAQARHAKAQRVGDSWVFPPVRAVQLVFIVANLMGLGFLIWGCLGRPEDRTLGLSVGFLFIIFTAVAWPKAVYSSEEGLRQRSWWNRWKVASWDELSSFEERQDETVIVRTHNSKIVFSPYHADRELYLEQLKNHVRKTGTGIEPKAHHGKMMPQHPTSRLHP